MRHPVSAETLLIEAEAGWLISALLPHADGLAYAELKDDLGDELDDFELDASLKLLLDRLVQAGLLFRIDDDSDPGTTDT